MPPTIEVYDDQYGWVPVRWQPRYPGWTDAERLEAARERVAIMAADGIRARIKGEGRET